MKPKIKITARQKEDEKKAKLLNELVQSQMDKYEGVVSAIVSAREYINMVYPFVKTPESMWDRILEEVIKIDIINFENKEIE